MFGEGNALRLVSTILASLLLSAVAVTAAVGPAHSSTTLIA